MVEEFIFWEPNTVIYKIGDKSDFAYLLKEGAVEILSENGTKVGYVNAKELNAKWMETDYDGIAEQMQRAFLRNTLEMQKEMLRKWNGMYSKC